MPATLNRPRMWLKCPSSLLLLLLVSSSAPAASASGCGGPDALGDLVEYSISGCGSDAAVCPLVRGESTQVNVTFVPKVVSQ